MRISGRPAWMMLFAALAGDATAATWSEGPGFRYRPLEAWHDGEVGFSRLVPAATGLRFTNQLDEAASAANRVLENGSGVAVGDYDGDEWPDVFFASLAGRSALFRNLGDGRFGDTTRAAGVSLEGEVARGAVFADLNGDRRPDLLVSTLARGVRSFFNLGDGRFRAGGEEVGLAGLSGATTLALADVDGNGTIDLYVTRYRAEDIRDNANVEARVVNGRTELHPKYDGRLFIGPRGLMEYGEPDALFLNDGSGRFQAVSWTHGAFLDEGGRPLAGPPKDWGLTAAFRDLNGDGLPDLYVCNDYWTPDRLWMNAGRGVFRAAPREALRHTSENSMGVDFADLDRDGHVDFLVVDMLSRDLRLRRRQVLAQTPMSSVPGESLDRPQFMRNVLFLNRGDGTFAEIAEYAGLSASDWSWQPVFLDVDLDGEEDVVIPAGHRRDVQDLDATERIRALQHPWPAGVDPAARQRAFTREVQEHTRLYPTLEMPVIAFRNLGGLRFEEKTVDWGLAESAVHQGIATADFDGDGDLDLVVNVLNGPAVLLRNEAAGRRVAVRLRGLPPNTEGIGAEIVFEGGAVPRQSREVSAGGRYLSGSEPRMVFATGRSPGSMSIRVRWRAGGISKVTDVRPDRLYEIDEAQAAPRDPERSEPAAAVQPLFEDVSDRLAHRHVDEPFDDFARQPLLPRRLSQGGPSVAWFDLNGDGWDDLLIGAGTGGRIGIYTNDGRGGFRPAHDQYHPDLPALDQSGLVAFRDQDGRPRVLVGMSAYESGEPSRAPAVAEWFAGAPTNRVRFLPPNGTATGPLALADVDEDGDLDLFVGGRVVPGRYPEPGRSRLLLQEGARWREEAAHAGTLAGLGLVVGAVWGDLDGEGGPELVVACEWGPIRVLQFRDGRLLEVTERWGLATVTGWWSSVVLGDFDEDGRLDLAAGNWGENSPYSATADRPAVLYWGDFLNRQVVDLLDTEWDPVRGVLGPRQRLDALQQGLPVIRQRYATHRAYSEASAEEVMRGFSDTVRRAEARTLASTVFLNRGGHFQRIPLPRTAQFAPVQGLAVADFDGDGHQDLVLAQNFFAVAPAMPRLDAGLGGLYRGLGDGRFEPVPPSASGLRIFGEQRGVAVADFDADGRTDLVVAQNNGDTRLFRNRGGKPGWRIRLRGRPGNGAAIGAMIRVGSGDNRGPVQVVTAGAGQGSQDGTTRMVPKKDGHQSITVRWPGGARSEIGTPAEEGEMLVEFPGVR